MSKGIIRIISKVQKTINAQIYRSIDRSNRYSGALAREGYNGGYFDALSDVLLALNGVNPNRNGWWDEAFEDKKENT